MCSSVLLFNKIIGSFVSSLRKLNNLLKPDRKRAEELKLEFSKGFHGIVNRIWPHINLVLACSTGI